MPVIHDMDGWMRNIERRMSRQESRPEAGVQTFGTGLVDPGTQGSTSFSAREVKNWSANDACIGGVVFSRNGSLNSPDGTEWWLGFVETMADGHGTQVIRVFHDDKVQPSHEYIREFAPAASNTHTFGAWALNCCGEDPATLVTNYCTDPKPLDVDNWQGDSLSGNFSLDSTYAALGLNAVWDHSIFGEPARVAPNGNGIVVNPLLPSDFLNCGTFFANAADMTLSFKMMSEVNNIAIDVHAEGYTAAGAYVADLDSFMSASTIDGVLPAMTPGVSSTTFDGAAALAAHPTVDYVFIWSQVGTTGGTIANKVTWMGSAMAVDGAIALPFGDGDTPGWTVNGDGSSTGPAPLGVDWANITNMPSTIADIDTVLEGLVQTVTGDGTTATVDNTDPRNPVVSAITGGGGFSGDAADLTGGPADPDVIGSGGATPTDYYRGDGAWADFDTQVRTNRLDQMAVPTADVSMGTKKITNLLDPVNAQDAETKAHVAAAIAAAISGGSGAATDIAVAALVADASPSLTRAALALLFAPVVAVANPATKAVAIIDARIGSSTPDVLGHQALAYTGSNTSVAALTATNLHTSTKRQRVVVVAAATNNVAGWRGDPIVWRGNAAGLGGFKSIFRFGPDVGQTIASRMFTGLTVATTAPTDVQPSSLVDCIGVGYDAADTQLYVIHNDNAGTATKVATGLTRVSTDQTKVYTLTIECASNASSFTVTILDEGTGSSFTTTVTTDLIAAASFLTPRSWCSVGGISSTIGMAVMGYYSEAPH